MSDTREKKRISTGAWVFLSVLVVIGAFFIFANMANSTRQDEIRREASQKQLNENIEAGTAKVNAEFYDKCMDEAYNNYKKQWDETAASIGSTNGRISSDDAEFLDKRHTEAKEECFKLYKTN